MLLNNVKMTSDFRGYLILICCLCISAYLQGQKVVIDNPDIIPGRLVKTSKQIRNLTAADEIKLSFPEKRSLKLGYHPKGDWILHEKTNPNALPLGLDPVLQKNYNLRTTRSVNASFEGGDFTNVNPPDPTIAVGPNHVVQMVNHADGAEIQIYDKTGNILSASSFMDAITGIPGAGDPIAIYDHLVDRWVLTEFGDVGNRLIFMVSTTPDPLGSYFIYEFETPFFPDYPKYALWPEMYVVTSNEDDVQAVYGVDRAKLLAGDNTATMQRFADLERFQSLNFQAATPVNLSGATLPDAAAPGIVMRIADDGWTGVSEDRLEIWELSVDFNDPANSALVGPLNLMPEPFDTELCGFTSFSCVQQPSGPNLDPLREVLMNRIHYRNFGTHETIVATHVTDVDGNDRTGVRWYELRRLVGGDWDIYQQGTFAPDDSESRWMSSIAINEDGSMVLAYNVSSSTTFPSLRYTGRTFCDELGTMPIAETSIIEGSASNGSNRYGDYNDISIDEGDGTFWFTGEYNPGSNWSTRIANLEIDLLCDVFKLSTTKDSDKICLGDASVDYTIDIEFLGTYNAPVDLSVEGLPAGVTAVFAPATVNSAGAAVLTITETNLAPGTYTFTVKGIGGGLEDEITLELLHIETLPSQIILGDPADGATEVIYNGSLSWTADPIAEDYLLEVATDMNFNTVIVSEPVDAASYDYTSSLDPSATYYWRVTGRNICGNGPTSEIWSFTIQDVMLSCDEVSPSNVPLNILDDQTVTANVPVSIGGTITDVNVSLLNITHTYIGDLEVTLVSPAGTAVTIFSRSCGTAENILAGYDDDAADSPPCPPVDGQIYIPANALSAFNGENSNGNWELRINDNAPNDQGILNAFTLEVCTVRPVINCSAIADLTMTIADGDYNYPDTLLSTGLVPANGDILFRAPNGIILDPGFEVSRTALFEAYLEACVE